jgi:hypothetical protein
MVAAEIDALHRPPAVQRQRVTIVLNRSERQILAASGKSQLAAGALFKCFPPNKPACMSDMLADLSRHFLVTGLARVQIGVASQRGLNSSESSYLLLASHMLSPDRIGTSSGR